MATNFIDVESRSLRQHFVFYKRLKEEHNEKYRQLHDSVLGKVQASVEAANRTKTLTHRLRGQALREREKECALLSEVFGANLSFDYTNPKTATDFIDVFNGYLNIKEIYERSKYLILNSHGQKGVYSFFPEYLKKVLDRTWEEVASRIDLSSDQTIYPEVIEWLESSVELAVKEMFDAEPELKSMPPELRNAYSQLSSAIGEVRTAGSFANQLANIYKLDELAQAITQELNSPLYSGGNIKAVAEKCKIDARKGGLTLEALYDLITAQIQSTKKGGHAVIGGTGMRADNVATFNLDLAPIFEILDNTKGNESRKEAVEIFNQIEQRMNNYGRGFIVYTSDKNYTLNAGFEERGGYAAGTEIKAEQLEELIYKAGYASDEFIGAILQFAEGAVAEELSPIQLENALAQMIAYFLFDDYNALKSGLTNGVNTLHVMNLNGVLLPISSVLFALVDAIERNIETQPRSIVSIKLHNDPILFKTKEDQREWEQSNSATPGQAWQEQRESALDTTTITVHFLASLRELLQNSSFR